MIGKATITFINDFLGALGVAQQYSHQVCRRLNHTHLPQLLKILQNFHVIESFYFTKSIKQTFKTNNPYPYENIKIRPNTRDTEQKNLIIISRFEKASYPFVTSRSTPSKPRIVSCAKLKE